MRVINLITQYTIWLGALITAGAGTMITYQCLRKIMNDDPGITIDANRKIKTTLKGAIIGVGIIGFINSIKKFYGF